MREPPYDRAFALAAQVLAMRDHYLEVRCGCGARRVIAVGPDGRAPQNAQPDAGQRGRSATVRRLLYRAGRGAPDGHRSTDSQPPEFGGDAVWSIPLRCPGAGAELPLPADRGCGARPDAAAHR